MGLSFSFFEIWNLEFLIKAYLLIEHF